MAARKRTSRTTRRSPKKSRHPITFGHIALAGLVALAIGGWFNSTQKTNRPTTVKTADDALVNAKPPTPKPIQTDNYSTTLSSKDIVLGNIPLPKAPIPAAAPTVSDSTHIRNKIVMTAPVPYKHDTTLPPQGRFAVNNAANAVFAIKKTAIYAQANNGAKIVAMVPRGQEMRSYEKNGTWHRIVVPSTDIIGWTKAENLSSSAITTRERQLQDLITGSIQKPSK